MTIRQRLTTAALLGLFGLAATLPGAAWLRCRTHYAANLMSAIPKSSWGWVKALLHSVHNQPDTESVHAQFDRILDALDGKLPAVAEHLEHARPDILAFTAFPYEVWRQIWSNNDREVEPRDPSAYRRGRDLPRPARDHPPGRRRPGRTTRRMGRIRALPRPRRPEQITHRQRHPNRTGGHPRGTDRLNHHHEESHDDVVHHVPGLDRAKTSSMRS